MTDKQPDEMTIDEFRRWRAAGGESLRCGTGLHHACRDCSCVCHDPQQPLDGLRDTYTRPHRDQEETVPD